MDFKNIVFSIVFVIWLMFITGLTGYNYILTSKNVELQAKNTKVLVKAVNSISQKVANVGARTAVPVKK